MFSRLRNPRYSFIIVVYLAFVIFFFFLLVSYSLFAVIYLFIYYI